MKFKEFLKEATIEGFMGKVRDCQTLEGLDELEKYYNKRVKDVELADSDDISIRDAINGKREEIKNMEGEEEL